MRIALLAAVATLAVPAVRVDVHPAPTGGVDLAHVIRSAADRALAQLPHRGQVTIDVMPNGPELVQQTGAGGRTDAAGDVEITWDSTRVDVAKVIRTWIPLTVAHELDHSSRFRDGPGMGNTLGDRIVAEGLADHFAHQVYPHAPLGPWDHALTKVQERAYWTFVRPRLGSVDIDGALFWGANGRFPGWAGYTLGYDIVGRYLAAHHLTGGQAVLVKTATILAGFHGV